jgi:hypothetical protein
MRWLRSWIVLVLLAVAGAASAQESDVLTGRVLGPDGRPVVGARVEVMSIETEITRSALTNDQGRYMIMFPDGGGRYLLRISYIGLADFVRTVMREGSEELLLTNATMSTQAIALDAISVAAQREAGSEARSGEQSTDLSQDLLNRLPLPDLDPNTLALLAAGVVGTGADSLTGRMGFSVAGMSELLNQITLDGVILGEGGMGVPEAGVRQTQITTSTFDASRGGFAGGQVSMSTARGGNRSGGQLRYGFDSDALQWNSAPTATAFTRHNLNAQYGGPLLRNRLFYSLSAQLTQNTNHRFALAATDPLAAQRAGAAPDSIARFLDILRDTYAVPIEGQTGAYDEVRNDLRFLGRVDWNIVQRPRQSHTLSASFNTNVNDTDSTRIGVLDLAQHGGDTQTNFRLASMSLTSRINQKWTNNLRFSFNENWNETFPYAELPEGRVRVTSDFEDGTRGTGTLVFGGNRGMPQESYARDLQLRNDLSFLQPIGSSIHRLKLGASVQRQRTNRRDTDNLFGTFTFNSLDDFAANLPERYERALAERVTRTGTYSAGLYFGDTWRVSVPLEVTIGLRWDRTQLEQKPEYNPRVEQLFGRRTDIDPIASGWSPRIGFNYRLNQQGQPARSLNGGIGLFAGRAPTNIFSAAVRQTGLPNAEGRLVCIGSAVPPPDWELYLADPESLRNLECEGDSAPVLSSRAPTVTLINPDQSLPSSLRADIGYRTQLAWLGRKLGVQGPVPLNLRYNYSRGFGLWGYRDLNLDESRYFTLANEQRPFFGTPSAIVVETGAASMTASRIHDELGAVYDVQTDRQSEAHQATVQLNGMLRNRAIVSLNYTLGFARDQASGSFNQATTAGNPNTAEWATSSNDRRHTLNFVVSYPVSTTFQLGMTTRISSGSPFTPMVDRDINGDGTVNDRAFVFDPRTAPDTALANGMNRLLAAAPARVRDCLESQLGEIAGRNTCRNRWTQSLSVNAEFRPVLPRFGRRLTFTATSNNVLTGLDQLINGREHMKGWGEGQRADSRLLQVRGFDPVTNAFRYEINEGFGQTRRGQSAFRNAFSITLQARLALGGNPNQTNVGFGQGGGFGGFAGGFGGGGGDRGLGGGPGGGGGGRGGPGGPGGGFGGAGELLRTLREPGAAANIDSIIDDMFSNPVRRILQLRDTLALTETQVATVQGIQDTLSAQHERRRAALRQTVQQLLPQANAGGANPGELMRQFQLQINPQLEGGRRETAEALRLVEQALAPEQWQKIPQNVRNAGGAGRGEQGGPGGRANFNAVGMIDRMLVNPLPVILSLKDTLQLTPEQVTQIEKASAELQQKLDRRREQLGKRFDNVDQQQTGRLFMEIQPDLEAGRRDITDALKQVEKTLSRAQWERIPERVRSPLQQRQRRGGGGSD